MEEPNFTSEELLQKAELLYLFVDMFTTYENTVRDYGGNQFFTMNEVHLLSAIAKNPGVFSTDLALQKNRSKSFISQIVTKLEKYGFVCKKTDDQDNKRKGLYVTEKGQALVDAHDEFDVKTLNKTYGYLRRDCSAREIEDFYKVVQTYVNIMTAAERKRRRAQMEK